MPSRPPARARAGLALALALAAVSVPAPVAAGTAAALDVDLSDPFDVERELPTRPEQRAPGAVTLPCRTNAPETPLTLLDAARRALCAHPATRQAWAAAEAQAAAVGVSQSAYWPTVSATAAINRVTADIHIPSTPELDSSFNGKSNEEALSLNWLVYDFGLRSAQLAYERALLAAATASVDVAVQSVFIQTAQLYLEAEQARSSFEAATQAEKLARQSVGVAQVKAEAGVGLESDRLQANTALAQATLGRIRAEGQYRNALGVLGIAVGLRPSVPFTLVASTDVAPPGAEVDAAIDVLIGRALRTNPRMLAAQARLDAARNAEAAARVAGRPNLAFGASAVRSDTPIDRVSTRQEIETTSVGLKLTIPLFEGFGRTYRIRQSTAEAEVRQAELFSASRDVERDVWSGYVSLRTSTDEREASRSLLASANESFELALGRYKTGVGSIIELLKAQSDLAAAREQEVAARARWRLARLQLMAALGQIDFPALH